MSALDIEAQIVGLYADAIKRAAGPLLADDDAAAQMVKAIIALADATAKCAASTAKAQREMESLARALGVQQPDPKPMLRIIDGNRL